MKQTVNFNDFRDAFRAYDRLDNFSRQGLEVLFDYLEQWEADSGEELELDVIAFCCDFNEDSTDNIARDYRIDVEGMDDEEKEEAVREYLSDNGAYIGDVSDGFVYRSF